MELDLDSEEGLDLEPDPVLPGFEDLLEDEEELNNFILEPVQTSVTSCTLDANHYLPTGLL